jgi:hypothetical protein
MQESESQERAFWVAEGPGSREHPEGVVLLNLAAGNRSYVRAMASLAVIGLIGMGAALLLPSNPVPQQA